MGPRVPALGAGKLARLAANPTVNRRAGTQGTHWCLLSRGRGRSVTRIISAQDPHGPGAAFLEPLMLGTRAARPWDKARKSEEKRGKARNSEKKREKRGIAAWAARSAPLGGPARTVLPDAHRPNHHLPAGLVRSNCWHQARRQVVVWVLPDAHRPNHCVEGWPGASMRGSKNAAKDLGQKLFR